MLDTIPTTTLLPCPTLSFSPSSSPNLSSSFSCPLPPYRSPSTATILHNDAPFLLSTGSERKTLVGKGHDVARASQRKHPQHAILLLLLLTPECVRQEIIVLVLGFDTQIRSLVVMGPPDAG
ncbi:hypothetical protein COCC4DRAFT_73948 [Bipolaris maydis ATCC 48331]|uniref:Uncharacterized protein n=1 Tax=Cochliobolus heterostrophus (strain C4 / ATCC 48331 / race T) TaxID=665024 RepID=N4X2T2_COCH4|nr:uncharacterized protein COCC4DRAFT_73948 [Bipolaris maydis ATCC 48331]ENI02808.1 hypothetical protein COCC4DRAFT_73948 [Bipolaris maydis ATCC 48331]